MLAKNSQSNPSTEPAGELTLLDIIEFLQESWKVTVSFMVIGVLGAALYFWLTPNLFEASAQIKMAQVPSMNPVNFNNSGINAEEPQAMISRMALPTTYRKETIVLCGLADVKDAEVVLASKVMFSIPKAVAGIVDVKLRDTSADKAAACLDAVYQLIKTSQSERMAPYISEAAETLKTYKGRLDRAIKLIAQADKSNTTISAVYLATRDEIRFLLDQIMILENIVSTSKNRSASLTAPIYVSYIPIYPKINSFLIKGALLGGFLGLIFALLRSFFKNISASSTL